MFVSCTHEIQDFESAFLEIDSAIQRHTTSLSGGSGGGGDGGSATHGGVSSGGEAFAEGRGGQGEGLASGLGQDGAFVGVNGRNSALDGRDTAVHHSENAGNKRLRR